MKFLECYTNWRSEDGVFVPPVDEVSMLINVEHIRAIQRVAPGVSQVFINLSDHVGRLYLAGDPLDVVQRIGKEGSATPC